MPLTLRCPIVPPLILKFSVNIAGGTAAVAATPTPSTSNDDAGEVVMVLLVWCARGAAMSTSTSVPVGGCCRRNPGIAYLL
jgi:hypothetical protein